MPNGKNPPRKKWNPIDMESAIRAVLKKDMGYLKAAKAHNNLPLTTLKDFVIKIRKEVSTLSVYSSAVSLSFMHLRRRIITK